MRRMLAVATAIFLPTVLMALLALSTPQAGQPGVPGQVTLVIDAYLKDHSQPTQTLRQIIPAARPWDFTPQMGRFGWTPATITTTDRSPAAMSTLVASWRIVPTDNKPLPFPPVAVWCVLLQSTTDASPRLVYVSQHEALYTLVWMVHEPTPDLGGDLSAGLARVGCDPGKGQ